jgi:hypothetical protein
MPSFVQPSVIYLINVNSFNQNCHLKCRYVLLGLIQALTLWYCFLQTIGFVGPGIALLGLNAAKSPAIASAWLTVAVGLKSFGHSGFLVNLQVFKLLYKSSLCNVATFPPIWCSLSSLTEFIVKLLPGDCTTICWSATWY